MENKDEAACLHESCDCQTPLQPESDEHNKLPRPPDISDEAECSMDDDYEDDDLDEIDDIKSKLGPDNPARLLLTGRPIVPHFNHPITDINDLVLAGTSSISLPPHHGPFTNKDIVWIGSSLGTMHQVPIKSHQNGSQVEDLHRSTSGMMRKIPSRQFSSLTMSSCGTDIYSFCRICQMQGTDKDPLISPCRCAGTLRYIHDGCLKKWIRISQRRGKKHLPKCELCHFQFNRHKQFKFSRWRWPRVRPRDKCLHIVFLLNLLIMVGCAIATIMCFLSDRDSAAKFPKNKVKLTMEEVITLTCGVMFFVAFFIAMTVEIKARHTLYKLFLRFIMQNTEWTIEAYDPNKDPLFKKAHAMSQV
ncbi:hypothetical protein ACF0H5_005479 [Mactra antiquata]